MGGQKEPRVYVFARGRIGAQNVSERTLVLSQHHESTGNSSQFHDGVMYWGTKSVYANSWSKRTCVWEYLSRGSLCQWLNRAQIRWSCLFENCKHAQTHPVEPYF